MTKRFILTMACVAALCARADEGMWTLYNLPNAVYERMQLEGYELPYDKLYKADDAIMKAVVNFSGYCSGVVVSPDGLVFTNHHCGFEAIRSHSTVEHDYMIDGFVAKSYDEELPNKDMFVSFMVEQRDITDEMRPDVGRLPQTERYAYVDSIETALSKAAQAKDSTLRVEVQAFYERNRYFATTYRDFRDLRLVFTIPKSMGKFGGETDNWMWPRQTCDFSVFRIYCDPKTGGPAEYSKDNVPYHPEHWARVSDEGYQEGSFSMTMGYPGSTSRYLSSYGIRERYEQNAIRAQVRGVKQEVMKRHMDAAEAVRIKYDSKYAQSSNYWKNSIGMNQAIADNKVLEAKAEVEKQFKEFAKGKPEYEGVVDKINDIVEKSIPVERQIDYLSEFYSAIEFRTPEEPMKKMKEAIINKDNAAIAEAKELIRAQFARIHNKDYDHEVDRQVAKAMIPALEKALSSSELPSFYQVIARDFKGNVDAYVDNIYNNSILANEANLEKFLKKPTIKAIDRDPSLAFVSSTMGCISKAMDVYGETEDLSLLHKAFIRGLGEMKQPTPSYPDANFTMRLTYGNVKSYDPKDGVHYKYYTTGDGVLQKENPDDPEFVVPAKLKELLQKRDFGRYAMKDGSLPACFLTTNDITGGNSGSPVMNDNGELIGIAFDGNWESLSGDINFGDNLQRCIAVDIRYVLFVIDKLGGAQRLINEMTINEQ